MKKIKINKEWGMLVISFLLGVGVTLLVLQLTTGGQLFQGFLTKTLYVAPTTTTTDTDITLEEFSTLKRVPSCVSAPSGMKYWWDGDSMDRGSTVYDLMNNANATLVNGTTTASGKVGNAFSFDGNNDSVDAYLSTTYSQITVDAWVKPDSFTAYQSPVIASQDGNLSWVLSINHDSISGINNIVFEYDNGSTYKRLLAGTIPGNANYYGPIVAKDIWRHVAVTLNASTEDVRVYIDGVSVPIVDQNYNTPEEHGFQPILKIGNSVKVDSNAAIGLKPWDGLIDEVEVFNRILSQSEVQTIFNAGSIGKCKPSIDISDVTIMELVDKAILNP